MTGLPGITVIDADTHVIECLATWDHFDGPARHRPALNRITDNDGVTRNRWLIDGLLVPKPDGPGGQFLATPPLEGAEDDAVLRWEWRTLENPAGRVADFQTRGISHQIVYPTLFIAYLTHNVAIEVELCKSYNRFMAAACQQSKGRCNWVLAPPLRDIDASIGEIEFGREHGAVGILFRGVEGDRSLADPYFDPVYRAAEAAGLPICIHTGPGAPAINDMADSRYMKTFAAIRLLPLIAFHDLVYSRVPERFPDLRFGFLESASSWVPFLLHFLRRSARRFGRNPEQISRSMFDEYNLFVACEVDEDIPYIAELMGWEHLLAATDYGHADQSSELDLVQKVLDRGDLRPDQVKMLLQDNPADFYNLEKVIAVV